MSLDPGKDTYSGGWGSNSLLGVGGQAPGFTIPGASSPTGAGTDSTWTNILSGLGGFVGSLGTAITPHPMPPATAPPATTAPTAPLGIPIWGWITGFGALAFFLLRR